MKQRQYHKIKTAVKHIISKFKDSDENLGLYLAPCIPICTHLLLQDKKGVKSIYRTFINISSQPFFSLKWNRDLGIEIDGHTWKTVFNCCFSTLKNNYIIWHQFKILNRILGCKYYMKKMNITANSTCRLCKEHEETLLHLYVECNKSRLIWLKLENIIKIKLNISINFDKLTIILGYLNSDNRSKPMNLLIMTIKSYIFWCARIDKLPEIKEAMEKVQEIYFEQRQIAIINEKLNTFDRNWLIFKNILGH